MVATRTKEYRLLLRDGVGVGTGEGAVPSAVSQAGLRTCSTICPRFLAYSLGSQAMIFLLHPEDLVRRAFALVCPPFSYIGNAYSLIESVSLRTSQWFSPRLTGISCKPQELEWAREGAAYAWYLACLRRVEMAIIAVSTLLRVSYKDHDNKAGRLCPPGIRISGILARNTREDL
ncbi:hypothetical protein CVT26_012691 [Gymnopilus dilepis]|uniref:Uncharacterized protein n=1 Tax=Gymnopilus dilepis TaxID=231916 RepID=A0A409X7E1_9AGAR|nr:hypothetical protein CVT26_012691 [Gymnopilus dilepis]